ncbi:DDE Tnp4 domain-containing protein [Mycena indigotica]|uniref:DDE Tnp4 domain-containing protein n=1 Tax=Mycena indigotica TaxID=2126181 RepID=A0A8H6S5X0_9AGAR|nr:DDE Tnp4 domain-containing protein [Mycena indigotica]KAF7292661.1 DDE Tnp4 domain-containing protein [Mycena indigotica]
MAPPTQREMIRRAILYQFQLRLLCIGAWRASLGDSDSESDDSDNNSSDSSDAAGNIHLTMLHTLQALLDTTAIIHRVTSTRYLTPRHNIIKMGQLELLTAFSQSPQDHERFVNMVRVSPYVFSSIVAMIENDPVFQNNSPNEQTPVDHQLAITLYRLGRFGNGGSIEDIARFAGVGHGSVPLFTNRCFDAIERLHPIFVRPLTRDEKEIEKSWIDRHLGFHGSWREGYIMYDGTIVPLSEKPTLNGQAYFTRKSNYGLNVQIGNVPSNLRIVDYSHGFTGSAHDASAFEYTAARKHPELLFEGDEHGFGDSAYALSEHMIPMFRSPAADLPENHLFCLTLSHLRVRSEHCMGALKGRWQSFKGLRQSIAKNRHHVRACRWITIGIILHNIVVELEGIPEHDPFILQGGGNDEQEDMAMGNDLVEGEAKRQCLVDEVNTFHRH